MMITWFCDPGHTFTILTWIDFGFFHYFYVKFIFLLFFLSFFKIDFSGFSIRFLRIEFFLYGQPCLKHGSRV
jgi:hypothetical protein